MLPSSTSRPRKSSVRAPALAGSAQPEPAHDRSPGSSGGGGASRADSSTARPRIGAFSLSRKRKLSKRDKRSANGRESTRDSKNSVSVDSSATDRKSGG